MSKNKVGELKKRITELKPMEKADKFRARLADLNSKEDYLELDGYFELVEDVLKEPGDKKLAREIYQSVLDGFESEGEGFYLEPYETLVRNILKTLKDKARIAKICKDVEGKIASRGGVFYDYCILAEIVMENLKDRTWAIKLLKKAEENVEESIGAALDQYDIEEEDSYYAILATKILDVLDDEEWGADVIVYAISECDMENNVAPIDCAYLLACQREAFADKVWNRLLKEEDLSDAKCFNLADAIMTIDGRLYGNKIDKETARVFKKDEAWHQKNIKRAKAFMKQGIDNMEESLECDDFDFDDAEKTLKILKDAKLTKLYEEAQKEAYR